MNMKRGTYNMKSYIVINSSIYSKYKEDILPLNARLFCDENFYNLDSYNVPLDLKCIIISEVSEWKTLELFKIDNSKWMFTVC